MLARLLLWLLQWAVSIHDAAAYVMRVQAIRLFYSTSVPLAAAASDSNGRLHLALRLNGRADLTQVQLRELVDFLRKHYRVTHLTLVAEPQAIKTADRCAERWEAVTCFENYEPLLPRSEETPGAVLVNVVTVEAVSLFCAFLSETAALSNLPEDAGVAAEYVCNCFSAFPPVDLYLCLSGELSFTSLYPLHLGFAHF